jgi:hypothetical protein
MKIFITGAAVALASGMLLGDAMRPILWAGDQALFPPADAISGGKSDSYGSADQTAYRNGPTPDYVIGTDWLGPADGRQDSPQPAAFRGRDP